ncbi:alpha-xylosidase 1-like, partial [Momordica charantia]|uniref:Alpha-xylosidase 1-like n=1 Tax=Momordica charantia TaxID=3673 RepID=A0A6J1D926_MOMCH
MAAFPTPFQALFISSLFLFLLPIPAYKIGNGYRLISVNKAPAGGILAFLQLNTPSQIYGSDIPFLQLFVKHETDDRLRVHITDAKKKRWEVPYNLLPRQPPPAPRRAIVFPKNNITISEYAGSELVFSYTADPFSFTVRRKSNGQTLFDSGSGESDPYNSLVFKDQYLEISTKLPESATVYGLGENTQPKGMKLQPDEPYTLYTTDVA